MNPVEDNQVKTIKIPYCMQLWLFLAVKKNIRKTFEFCVF
jgi:hypothetical protein